MTLSRRVRLREEHLQSREGTVRTARFNMGIRTVVCLVDGESDEKSESSIDGSGPQHLSLT